MAQLLLSLAVFGVGFVARPLGGIVIGSFADRVGRKPAMTLTLWLMALGSAVFVLAPTHAQVGMAAPVIIIVGRLIQGFAIGGEMGASTAMLLEYADNDTRGYYGSWQLFSQAVSTLAGSALGLMVTGLLSPEALESWGWRIPFVLGLAVVPIGSYIRSHLEETAHVPAAGALRPPSTLGVLLRDYRRQLLIGFALIVGGTTSNYIVLHYLTNYASAVLHMPLSLGLWAAWIAAALQMLLSAFAGRLSDRLGRRKVIAWAYLRIMMLCVLPAGVHPHGFDALGERAVCRGGHARRAAGVCVGGWRGADHRAVPTIDPGDRPVAGVRPGCRDLRRLRTVQRHLADPANRLQPGARLVHDRLRLAVADRAALCAGNGGAAGGLSTRRVNRSTAVN